jgi:4a-hydroxytetrahydrobiopterin dehydratase
MADIVTATQFHERNDRPDWRFLLGRIEATFRAGSFDGAARFAVEVAAAAEQAGHHPDVDIRYPDRVHVALTTHAAGGRVTHADVTLAGEISALAAEGGLVSEPTEAQALEVAIDALDIEAVRPFWEAVLGYEPETPSPRTGTINGIVDPARIGPAVWFQQMDEPRPQRNRIHLDVTVPHDVAEERIAAAIAAGGTLLSDRSARAFWILADPEGNEVCICTSQDRD